MKMIALSVVFFSFGVALAADSAAVGDRAVENTQRILTDPGARSQAISGNPAAAQADKNIEAAVNGNPASKQELYDISAALIPWMVQQANGDANELLKLVSEAQRDPKGFLERMPASEKARIKALAGKVESGSIKTQKP